MRRRPSYLSRVARVLAACAAMWVLLPATAANALPPRITTSFTRSIERYASYQGQSTCQPVAQPGVLAFRDLLLQTYRQSRSLGIVRGCTVGGRSEHKEGRALDWGVRVTVASERAAADEVIRWLLATDKYGNRHALFRRLGLMYMIWNRQIWSAYRPGWRAYTGSSPHTDHIHFSFSWAGARRQTSFWTGHPLPGSSTTSPTPAPVPGISWPLPEPARPDATVRPAGTDLQDETVRLSAAARTVRTRGVLRAGRLYHVEVSGTWSYGRGRADAECSTAPGASIWQRDRSVDKRQPRADHLDLYLNGTDITSDPVTNTGDRCDSAEHRYRWDVTPSRTLNAYLSIWDPSRTADNTGALTIRIWRDRQLTDETVTVRARRVGGDITRTSVVAGQRYAVTATGRYSWGGGSADAECSITATDPTWRRDRSVDPDAPDADHLDLQLMGDDPRGAPAVGEVGTCDPAYHVYRTVWTAPHSGPVPLSIWDVDHSDNIGGLKVRITKVAPLTSATSLSVPASVPQGATTKTMLERGREYSVEVTGSYTWPGGTADAECSSAVSDATWRRDRAAVDGHSLELVADGSTRSWQPVTAFAEGCDAAANRYRWTFTASRDMQLSLRADAPAGSAGTFASRIVPGRYAAMSQPESQLELPPTAQWVETLRVNADGRVARTAATLQSDRTYVFVATGGFDHGHGEADAECATTPGVPEWRRDPAGATAADALDLVVDGHSEWAADVTDEHGCSAAHTYTMQVQGRGTRMPLLIRGLDPADNRRGYLTVRVYRV